MRGLSRMLHGLLLAVLIVFSGFPIYWMVSTALSTNSELYRSGQVAWPRLGQVPALLAQLAQLPLPQWLANTAVVAVGTTALSLALGTLAGYALSRFRFHGQGLVGFLLFTTQVIPEALLLVPLYAMFITLGLLNSRFGLVLANVGFSLPVTAFILKGAIDAVPREIDEAAIIDNCPRLSALTLIMLPLIAPSLAAASVIAFFGSWNEYLFAATFLRDPALWPASVGLASFIGQYETPMSAVMGSALAFSLPAVAFFLLVQRRIVAGLTAGAVKG